MGKLFHSSQFSHYPWAAIINFTMYISNHFHTFRLDFICHWLWISNFSSYSTRPDTRSQIPSAQSTPGLVGRPHMVRWNTYFLCQCQSQILQSQCTMFQGKLLRVGLKKTCDPRFGNLQVSISTHHLSEIHSFYNLLERWTLFGVVWSFLVRLRIMLIYMLIILEGTQSKKCQKSKRLHRTSRSCLSVSGYDSNGWRQGWNVTVWHMIETRCGSTLKNTIPHLFAHPWCFENSLTEHPPPPLVTRHPRRSAMCQATFDFDLLPVFGALAAIQIMLKLRHRARHRVCLQTQVQCCSWHRHQPTITTFHHETHKGLVRKQAWAFFFYMDLFNFKDSLVYIYNHYISYIFPMKWAKQRWTVLQLSECKQKDMFCLSKYD